MSVEIDLNTVDSILDIYQTHSSDHCMNQLTNISSSLNAVTSGKKRGRPPKIKPVMTEMDNNHIISEIDIVTDVVPSSQIEVSNKDLVVDTNQNSQPAIFSNEYRLPQKDLLKEDVPEAYFELITLFHSTSQGHFGVEKTLNKILSCKRLNTEQRKLVENVTSLRKYVIRVLSTCPCCQKASAIKPQLSPYRTTLASYIPMVRLDIDTIGPLPEDKDGNKYIINIVDSFSRYVNLFATKDATAKTAAECLWKHVNVYGIPKSLLSDNGTQYVNSVILLVLIIFSILVVVMKLFGCTQ